MNRRYLLFLGLAAGIAGCSTFTNSKQVASLDSALGAYTGAVRWGHLDTAAAFARPRSGQLRGVDQNALAGLKVTGYTVRINHINETADEASVSISFTFYHEDQATLRQSDLTSIWYYSATENAWYMDSNLPDFSH